MPHSLRCLTPVLVALALVSCAPAGSAQAAASSGPGASAASGAATTGAGPGAAAVSGAATAAGAAGAPAPATQAGAARGANPAAAGDPRLERALSALKAAGPELGAAAEAIRGRIESAPGPFLELLASVEAERASDPGSFARVDKKALPLAPDYQPADLVALDGSGLSVSRAGHRLRRAAFEALREIDRAARAEGLVLLVSSSYRSFEYQREVFARNARELGELEARRVSAEPGRSQHQLGTAVDFGSIDDSFAETRAGRWLLERSRDFGFSLSYPKGFEGLTGYVWESWHYRFLGKAACRLERDYFGGLQQYLIVFLSRY